MKFKELLKICNPIAVYGSEPSQMGILRTDSRDIKKNDVFIALRGTRTDGHHFIKEVVEKEASAIICEEAPEASKESAATIILVKNTRELAGPVAQLLQDNPARKLKITGITGTNGKTTVATLVWQLLQKLDTEASLLGTVEKRVNDKRELSRLTTADAAEIAADMKKMVDAGSTHLVMEVSSHALHQQRVNGISFDVAAFTNLSLDHLDYHGSMEEYAKAKKILFNSLNHQAKAVVNADDTYADFMVDSTKAEKIFFSFKGRKGVPCKILKMNQTGLLLDIDGTTLRSPLVGDFNARNLAQAFLACRCLGFNEDNLAKVAESCFGAPGRLEPVIKDEKPEHYPAVFVDYAHTPDALENVSATLHALKEEDQKLTIIFGCGGDRDRTKRPQMAAIAEKFGDRVVVTSDNPRTESPESIVEEILTGFSPDFNPEVIVSREEAIKSTILRAESSDIILVAGKGHETYQEINGERRHFDDREIARNALSQKNGEPEKTEVA